MCSTFDPLPAAADPGPSICWYWRGGAVVGRWRDALPVASRAEALAQAAQVERMGWACVVLPVGLSHPVGAPRFWDFRVVRRVVGVAGEGA